LNPFFRLWFSEAIESVVERQQNLKLLHNGMLVGRKASYLLGADGSLRRRGTGCSGLATHGMRRPIRWVFLRYTRCASRLYFNVGFVGRFIARTPANGAECTSRF